MKKYFRLLVEGKRDDDWGAYFANLKKNIKPYGKQLVNGETGKIVTTGPTDSQHYDIVLSNLGQFGFQSRQHMADTVNAHNANNPNYKPLTGISISSEEKGFGPVIDYLQDQGWAHVTHQPSDRRPTTYIRTANHAAAQSAMSLIKDQLLPEVSVETKTHVSELRSRQEIEHYRTSTDPSALIYTDRKPTIGTRQPTDAEKYDADRIIRKTIPKYKMEAESFTFSKLRTQLNEERKELLVEGKEHRKPKILAPGIMPVGKFIIHPKTNKIMLADPAFPDALHTSIALNYGFDNVNDAQSKGWVKGSYIKPNRMGGNGLLHLEGYHGHEDLRKLLSRLSDVIPNNVDFMVDNYDREKTKTDFKNFTGTEALNQYINGGRINPIVAPTSTSTPTDYNVEKELRKTVPESQRAFESFTFSELRTQLNEERKDLIREMHPIMFIHTDPSIPTYHIVAGDTNRQTHDELAKDAIEDHYNKRPSGNLSDQLLSLGPWTRIHTYPAPRVLGSLGQKSFEIESASHEALRDTLGRIEPHISGHKVHIAVRDFGSGGEWSKRVDAEQLRDYIKHGYQARSLRVESWQEYDAKVGETNTSLFEPGNTKFNMKAFLKKLRKKNGVGVNLPGEN